MKSIRTVQNRLHKLKVEIMEIEESIKKADIIIHLAAINGTRNFYNIPSKVFEDSLDFYIDLVRFLGKLWDSIFFSNGRFELQRCVHERLRCERLRRR